VRLPVTRHVPLHTCAALPPAALFYLPARRLAFAGSGHMQPAPARLPAFTAPSACAPPSTSPHGCLLVGWRAGWPSLATLPVPTGAPFYHYLLPMPAYLLCHLPPPPAPSIWVWMWWGFACAGWTIAPERVDRVCRQVVDRRVYALTCLPARRCNAPPTTTPRYTAPAALPATRLPASAAPPPAACCYTPACYRAPHARTCQLLRCLHYARAATLPALHRQHSPAVLAWCCLLRCCLRMMLLRTRAPPARATFYHHTRAHCLHCG